MEINDLLKGMDCSCGRHHTCDIGYVSIAKGAICALSALVSAYETVLLVADENTFGAAGAPIPLFTLEYPDFTVLPSAKVFVHLLL